MFNYLFSKQATTPLKNYTMQSARDACLKELDKPVYHMCKTVPGLDLDSYIDDCAKDAVVSMGGSRGGDRGSGPPWNCQIISFCHVEIFRQTPFGNLDPSP